MIIHGMYGTSFYQRWCAIKTRCTNKNHPAYHRYGGRGIKHPWKKFQSFKEDLFDSYKEHVKIHGEKYTQLDRINNNKSYSKENCRWVTPKQNVHNASFVKNVTFRGETKCLKEWSRILGGSKNILYERLNKGWSFKKALLTPIRKQ